MKNKQGAPGDVSAVLARLRKLRARGRREAVTVGARLARLRKAGTITQHQYNDVMGITIKKESNEIKTHI